MCSKSQTTKGEPVERWEHHELRRKLLRELAAKLGRRCADASRRSTARGTGLGSDRPGPQDAGREETDP